MAYCRECGNKVEDTDKFCSKCGQVQSRHESNVKPSKRIKVIALTMALIVFCSVMLLKLDIFKSNLASINLKFNAKTSSLNIGDYIEFGSYLNEPILWRVINKDENGIMLFSDKVLCFKAFDARGDEDEFNNSFDEFNRWGSGSNYWASSNIREWLNSNEKDVTYTRRPPTERAVMDGNAYVYEQGFLNSFNQYELDAVQEVTHKVLLSEEDILLAEGGTEPISYYEDLNFNADIYDNSYYQNVTDKVFLLSVKELKNYVYERGWDYRATSTPQAIEGSEVQHIDPRHYSYSQKQSDRYAAYWLRTPSYVYPYNTYVIEYSGGVYTIPAYSGDFGVRPALYIKDDLKIAQGDGSVNNPYSLKSGSRNDNSNNSSNLSYTTNTQKKGNTVGNKLNLGLAASNLDWVYYTNGEGIYKIGSIGGNSTFVSDVIASSINVIGDTIYYIEEDINSQSVGIYKMKTNGTKKIKISDDKTQSIYVLGEYIYFTNLSDESKDDFGCIYRIKVDGSSKEKITYDKTGYFSVVDNEIYYLNFNDGNRIYKIDIDSKKSIRLGNDESNLPIVVDNWIYYINMDDNNSIYRMKTDGSEVMKFDGVNTDITFNVSGDYIYYSNSDDKGSLYKVNRYDGSERIKLNDDVTGCINILDEDIYYIAPDLMTGEFYIFNIGINGENRAAISTVIGYGNLNIHQGDSDIEYKYIDLSNYIGVNINELISKFGNDYWTDYFMGGQYYAFMGVGAYFFPDDNGDIGIIMGYEGTSYKDVKVGMLVGDVKKILGNPHEKGFDDISDDYENPYYMHYYFEDTKIFIRSKTVDGPIIKIDIRKIES